MKEFIFDVVLHGIRTIDDRYSGPSQWRGSGVYDSEVKCDRQATITVIAEDYESAKRFIDGTAFEWDDDVFAENYDIDSWDDNGIVNEKEGIWDVEYGTRYY